MTLISSALGSIDDKPTIDTAIVQSSQPVLWNLILVYSRRHTETNARTVKVMTMCLQRGPRSSALRTASSSAVYWSIATVITRADSVYQS